MGSKSIVELCTRICSGGTPKSSIAEYYEGGAIPWLNTREINFNRITRTEGFITEAGLAASSAKWIKPNAVIVAMYGATAGKCAIAKVPLTTNQACCNLEINDSIADHRYIYYWLMAHYSQVAGLANGGAQQNLNARQIRELRIDLPELSYQKKVSDLVSALDDAIDLNQRANDYLSELAQVLFIGWFEEHAGEREIASLTDGGEYCTLDKLCSRITDGAHKSPKADPDGVYPMLSVKDMRRYGFSYSSCKRISKADYDGMLANDCVPRVDDILVAKDGSYLKEIFITDEQREEAILSSIAIFRPDTRRIAPEVLLQYLKHPRVLKLVSDNFVSGSALPRIVLKDFKKLMLFVPERGVQEGILPALRSIRKLIRVNEEESARLSSLRDLLLPKLISGEIDVSEVELPMQSNNHLSVG